MTHADQWQLNDTKKEENMTHDLQFSNNVLKSKRNREFLESAVTGWKFTAEVLSKSISVLHLVEVVYYWPFFCIVTLLSFYSSRRLLE